MFLIKKSIALFLMPFPIFLMLVGVGLYFWHRNNQRYAKRTLLFAIMWISLLSYAPFSALLLSPLEHSNTKISFPLMQPVPKYIHVLGNAHVENSALPLSSQLSYASLTRVIEGVSIYNTYPKMKIIFSGYGGDEPVSNARKNSQLAIRLGVNANDIILLENAKDTEEEAVQSKKIVGNEKVILVTSASHMPRASTLFKNAGVETINAPTDFQVKKQDTLWQLPSAEGLMRSEAAFHEYLGIAWAKIQKIVSPEN